MYYLLFGMLLFLSCTVLAQNPADSVAKIQYSGYAEAYYSYSFSRPSQHEKESFLYNYKRHNEVNINLAYAKANYTRKNIRANLALMIGNYAQYNLSAEPSWAQLVYEANMGIRLTKQANWWLDVGVLPSHIGFESAVGADCWTLTRSLVAENSPYFETGVKLGHTSRNGQLQLAFLLLNGWQRIQKPTAVQMPSAGFQVYYHPNNIFTLNYSNFIGTDKPDSLSAFRTYHNFYLLIDPATKWGITLGFDIGTDQYNNQKYGVWYVPTLLTRYKINHNNKLVWRLEYFNDAKQIIIAIPPSNNSQIWGTSLNYDHSITNNVLWRIEGKYYRARNAIFQTPNGVDADNVTLTTALSIKL
ncbi:MAG TPA: porin [Chitinophagales bacterium]|nr:porin [Chitinophagales bacterium]